MSIYFVQKFDIVPAIIPVDLQTADNNGDWCFVGHARHVACVFFAAIGTAGDDPTLTVNQATTNTGTGSKALTFTDLHHKAGALLTAVGQWTRVTQTAANTYVNATHAEVQKMYVVSFRSDELDSAGGFDHIQMAVADVGGNAQLGCGFYLLELVHQVSIPPSNL